MMSLLLRAVEADTLATDAGAVALLDALRKDGAVLLRDAVRPEAALSVLASAIRLFELPREQKLSAAAPAPLRPGFRQFGMARALDTGIPNALESWGFSRSTPDCIPQGERDLWFLFARFGAQLSALAELTLLALDRAYDTPGEIAGHLCPPLDIELMHYPRRLVGRAAGSRRQSVHRDSSVITLLPHPSGPGLCAELSGSMVPITPEADEVLVLVGSALEHLTAGDLPACVHTVETPAEQGSADDRTSVIFFVPPRAGSMLEPISSLRGRAEGGAFAAIAADEHQRGYTRRVFGDSSP
jgi:isopenicillin N synthase-like dioxygenase